MKFMLQVGWNLVQGKVNSLLLLRCFGMTEKLFLIFNWCLITIDLLLFKVGFKVRQFKQS